MHMTARMLTTKYFSAKLWHSQFQLFIW